MKTTIKTAALSLALAMLGAPAGNAVDGPDEATTKAFITQMGKGSCQVTSQLSQQNETSVSDNGLTFKEFGHHDIFGRPFGRKLLLLKN